ncbi:MAG: inorganic phosphate transporter [Mangrovibacterium sp.]
MENFYLILVIVLFALAISDLIVGVSNDAVNFLNSAIGSKAAPKWVIFGIASLGILVGSCFSGGMMEIAKSGVFHPDMFVFKEIMIIFLAVMITDVILLDMFNSFGMPTSTTVSIVFELLGSAVAVALVKIDGLGNNLLTLADGTQVVPKLGLFINSGKALAIISGILVSVVIAFSIGALVQYLARIVFSFRQKNTLRLFGSVFGGFAIASMTYFMIIKGAKGATFITENMNEFMNAHMFEILLYSFIGWTIILQVLSWLFKLDILATIVVVGTFGLSMAFAGNDLVNFIGVPLAGLESFNAWVASGGLSPETFTMEMLLNKQKAPELFLIISGLIMIVTLITSKKAKAVINTSVDLARQSEGEERFNSSVASRFIVRVAMQMSNTFDKITPKKLKDFIDTRFEQPKDEKILSLEDGAAFDKIRACINLIVSGILISIGTAYKLPLSTTYVTFMVAMGTSLADRAWGRDSAVYRISGVFSVIGGWFLTALIAFTASLIIATLISITHVYAIFVFIIIALFVVFRTQLSRNKKNEPIALEDEELSPENELAEKVFEKTKKQTENAVVIINSTYNQAINSFIAQKRGQMKKAMESTLEFNKKTKKRKSKVAEVVNIINRSNAQEIGHYYVHLINYTREASLALTHLIQPLHEHIENNHKPFTTEQSEGLSILLSLVNAFSATAKDVVENNEFSKLAALDHEKTACINKIVELEKSQIKRIKAKEVNTRNSMLFFNLLTETKTLLLAQVKMVEAKREFYSSRQ